MLFQETAVAGAVLIEPEFAVDDRGGFGRIFDRDVFVTQGLDPEVTQCSISFNRVAGTLRGLHYQLGDAAEAKLVRCTAGRLYDVAADLRPGSPTYLRWCGVELTPESHLALYVPRGCAHGFITLEDATEVFYQISTAYRPGSGAGVRWDDPMIGIRWPRPPVVLSRADANLPLWEA